MREDLQSKVAASRELIRQQLAHAQNPVVLWSGGKDSTAMLHLVRSVTETPLPVVQWREPRFRSRYAYSDQMIREWDLEVYDYAPGKVAMTDGFDVETGKVRFDFLKYYQWGASSALVLSLGTEPPEEGKPYLCAIKDIFARPLGTFAWPWDACFHGQKSADLDLIKGQVPLAQDVRETPDTPNQIYPMRYWTDEDVFEYLESCQVPMDPTRYQKLEGKWGHKPDKSQNADYYPVCWNCVNRHESAEVWCPKFQKQLPNLSHLAPYEDIVIDEQGFRATWDTDEVNGVKHVVMENGCAK